MDTLTELLKEFEESLAHLRQNEQRLESQLAEQRVLRIAQDGAVQGVRIAIERLQSLESLERLERNEQ